MKKFTCLLILTTLVLNLTAQEFSVPKDLKLVNAADYAPYEKDVVEGIGWITELPMNELKGKRKQVNSFILQWLAGSPYVHIELNGDILTFTEKNPELLMMFLGGWAKYSIESKNYDDKAGGNLAGIEAAIYFYNKNKEWMEKDKNMEKYIKMQQKGTLKKHIEDMLERLEKEKK